MKIIQILSFLLLFVTQLTFAQSPKLIKTETEIYRVDETKWEGRLSKFILLFTLKDNITGLLKD